MTHLFITATGTDIGKTLVTASLAYQLRQAGTDVHAIKPLISGVSDQQMQGSDTAVLCAALGQAWAPQQRDRISPLRYKAPLAPSMAAKAEGRTVDYDAVLSFCRQSMANHNSCLIEGVGGAFVPLTQGKLVADWIKDLALPSLVVCGSYLGTLSHTLATVEAMQARGLPVLGIVVSESSRADSSNDNPDLGETVRTLEQLTRLPVQALPRLQQAGDNAGIWQQAPDLLDFIGLLDS